MRYAIVIEKSLGNYSAYVPDLPGQMKHRPIRRITPLGVDEAVGLHGD